MSIQAQLEPISNLLHQLILYRDLNNSPLIQQLLKLTINQTADRDFPSWYGQLLETYPQAENPWAAAVETMVANAENYFSIECERDNFNQLPLKIKQAIASDLQNILTIMAWNPAQMLNFDQNEPLKSKIPQNLEVFQQQLVQKYQQQGAGDFGTYASFVWQHSSQCFKPVLFSDPINFDQLIGYEYQKRVLQQNTLQFINNLPANNILLYGDRGTGKSSSVKALIHQFSNSKLRLIEVSKNDLTDFPIIVETLRHRGLKFVLYIDDLSFESGETGYKALKTLLEGGLTVKPDNLIIYATSNRRHLLRETFSEREDEIHGQDTVEEQLSLSDRFGITLSYSSPDQTEFLAIVQGLATQRQLAIDPTELERRALQWERYHNGRNGRTARQFIDQLQGELEIGCEQ